MELIATPRTILGKKVKSLRTQGLIPAELYGHGMENKHISVPEKEFNKLYETAGEHTIIHLVIGKKTIPALIAEVQKNPLSGKPIAADFHAVRMDETIETSVPIVFTGEAPAIKAGFIVVRVLDELDIEALPANIPQFLEADISNLAKAGDVIAVKDIAAPDGVKILDTPETVIASVTEKEKEETAAPPGVETAEPATTETKTPAETQGHSSTEEKK